MKVRSCRRKYVLEYTLAIFCLLVAFMENAIFFLPLSGVCVAYAELMRVRTHILFDDSKISVVHGILNRNIHAIYLENVSDISVRQHLWQRFLGYGIIILRSNSGTENLVFPPMKNPRKIVSELEARIESNKRMEVMS